MSLYLSDSGNIRCSAPSGFGGRGFYNNKITIGDYDVKIDDFCELALYIFTNTDLENDDPRIAVVSRIKNLVEVDGYNRANKRFQEAQQVIQPDNAK